MLIQLLRQLGRLMAAESDVTAADDIDRFTFSMFVKMWERIE